MFKSGRWRSEKNKIKAVFKLQFHATQVSQLLGDALMISVVPMDVGKPSVRSDRATIQDGSCYWENPVYETVKLVQEPKTGRIHERIYHFVVLNGSSKASIVGEVSIDFANYAEATKISSVSLPLKNAKSDAVLHVSIQRMQDCDQRDERSLNAQLTNGDADESIKSISAEDSPSNKTMSHVAELNGNHRASSGSDITVSSSESSFGLDTPQEVGMKKNGIHHDPPSFLSSLSRVSVPQLPTIDASMTTDGEHQRSQWEWSEGSAPEVSTDDSSSSPRGTLIPERSLEASDIVVDKLKAELAVLGRQAEMSDLELQTLRKQIVKESKRGHDLSREIVSLKEERDSLSRECEQLKVFQKHLYETKAKDKLQFEGGDPQALLEELRQELSYEKDLNANLRLQLQKTQESNSQLILAVHDLDEILEQKNKEILNLSSKSATSENAKDLLKTNSKCETDDDDEQKALEVLVMEHNDAKEAYLMEQKIMDLRGEIEIYKRDRDELEMQTEQLALDYEILKQENHDISYKLEQSQLHEQLKMQYECSSSYAIINELENQIESLESELKKQSKQFSGSLVAINELETHVKNLEEELEKQAQGFELDLEALTHAKVEQEQRAIRAEETLRKTRWQNVNTAKRLQEEFRRLSVQMASSFDANEKLATKALTEANELRLQKSHLEEMFQKAQEELQSVKDSYEGKMNELSSQITSKMDQIEQMQSKVEEKSTQLELQKKHDEEARRLHSREIQMLGDEIEKLTTENSSLSVQTEENETLRTQLEQMKTSIKEAEMLLERGSTEKMELENMIFLVKKEKENSLKELNIIRCLKEEKESVVRNLQSELESIKLECNALRRSSFDDGLEKERLREQVLQLKSDLKKKEDVEKKLKDSNGRTTVLEVTKTTSRNNKSVPVPRGSKEAVNLKEQIKLLQDLIKQKETALETSTNKFLEKEKDLQNTIEDLERRIETLNQHSTTMCEYEKKKIASDAEDLTLNAGARDTLSTMASMSIENRNSTDDILLEKEPIGSATDTRDEKDIGELLNEIATLKERDKSMECELKEIQERYSEMSLKFAEVEGERQKLVMMVRSLKNTKKKLVTIT